jgi:MFS family permease
MTRAYLSLILHNRNFRLLWLAQIVSELGDWFYTLAVYNLLLELTGSRAQSVGLAVVLQVLPSTFFAPTAGVVNDRMRRKHVMIAADIARFFIVLSMLLVRSRGMVWLAYPLLFLETIGGGFFEPAHSSVIPNIVPEDQVLTANALSAITWSFCLAIGAALGGVTAVWLGRDMVFVLNAVSFLVSAFLIGRMQFAEPHIEALPPLRGRDLVTFTPILEGFQYIRRDRRLFATVFVKAGGGLLGANNVLLPILGERVFPMKAAGLDHSRAALLGMSMLMGSRGVGALIGPLISGRCARHQPARLRIGILAGFLIAAVGYVCLGTSASFLVAVAAVAFAHAGTSTNWVFSSTLLQVYTEDRFRGRVFSADYGLCMFAIAASSYIAGVALDFGVAPRTLAVILGIVMFVPALWWGLAQRWSATTRSPGPGSA